RFVTHVQCPVTGVAIAARLWLAKDIHVAHREQMPLRIGPGARRRDRSQCAGALKGSGGAESSAVLPRLDDGKPSPSPRRLPADPAALRTPLSLSPLGDTKIQTCSIGSRTR